MNTGLLIIFTSTGLFLVDLQSYGERVLVLGARFVSAAQSWIRTVDDLRGPALMVTIAAGAAAVAMFVCLMSLRSRARREKRHYQEEIARQAARAEAAESANAAKAEFLGSMSHQIRTPLNAIVGFTELALKTDLAPQLRESLDTVRTSADWLMYTVNDVLEFSRIEAGTVQLHNIPFSISECIESAMKIVEREAAVKKLKTACKMDPGLPQVVRGDPTRLRHVLFNLLDNAVRFTTSGSIIVSVALESNDAEDVLIRVSVTDTGIGIPPAKRALIFEPFRQLDEGSALKSRATVLGLPISRRLIELMGGTISFQSQLGAGSTFEFTARFGKQKPEELETPVQARENAGGQELSILVVEDNAVSRRLITKVLESAGHRVWTASNGREALHLVETEAFDLIFMDMEMPDLDGLETTRAIRTNEAPGLQVPIYAVTAHVLPSDRERCIAAGMNGFLTKPIAVNEVFRVISKVAPSKTYESAADARLKPAEKAPGVSKHELEKAPIASSESVSQIRTADDSAEPIDALALAVQSAEVDSDPIDELALRAIWKNPGGLTPDAANVAEDSNPSETDAGSIGSFVDNENDRNLHSTVYQYARASADDREGFRGPISDEMKAARDIAIHETGNVLVSDSQEHLDRQVNQPSPGGKATGIDNGLAASSRVHAELGLALLEASSRLTCEGSLPATRGGGQTPAPGRDPFEQARKALSNCRFDVRVIHNNGDPSDRDLI